MTTNSQLYMHTKPYSKHIPLAPKILLVRNNRTSCECLNFTAILWPKLCCLFHLVKKAPEATPPIIVCVALVDSSLTCTNENIRKWFRSWTTHLETIMGRIYRNAGGCLLSYICSKRNGRSGDKTSSRPNVKLCSCCLLGWKAFRWF